MTDGGPREYDREYTDNLSDVMRIRLGYGHNHGEIIRFAVQLESGGVDVSNQGNGPTDTLPDAEWKSADSGINQPLEDQSQTHTDRHG